MASRQVELGEGDRPSNMADSSALLGAGGPTSPVSTAEDKLLMEEVMDVDVSTSEGTQSAENIQKGDAALARKLAADEERYCQKLWSNVGNPNTNPDDPYRSTSKPTKLIVPKKSMYDGREMYLHQDVLATDELGFYKAIPSDIVSALKRFLEPKKLAIMPPEWFQSWGNLQKGLQVCRPLKKGLFDAEMADHGNCVPQLTIISTSEDCGAFGSASLAVAYFRRYNPTRLIEPLSIVNYRRLLDSNLTYEVYRLDYNRMKTLMDERDLSRGDAIVAAIEEMAKTQPHCATAIQEKAAARASKELRREEAASRQTTTHGHDRRTVVVESSDPFIERIGRQSRRNKLKQDNIVPDARQIPTDGSASDQSDRSSTSKGKATTEEEMETSRSPSPPVKIKKERTPSPAGKPPGVTPPDAGSGGESGKSLPKDDLEKQIWENARSGFQGFIPAHWGQCAKGSGRYSIPPEENLDHRSDDEDWCRSTGRDPLVSSFYKVWLEGIEFFPDTYYTKEQKAKLKWACKQWSRDNLECPFQKCQSVLDTRKKFVTKERYFRHLVDNHTHHFVVYQCDPDRAGTASCSGHLHQRRGRLINHMAARHNIGGDEARTRVMALHERVITAFKHLLKTDPKSLNSSKAYFCEIEENKSKLNVARLAKVPGARKFDIDPEIYQSETHNTFRRPASRGRGSYQDQYHGPSDRSGSTRRSRSSSPATHMNQGRSSVEQLDSQYYTDERSYSSRSYESHRDYPDEYPEMQQYSGRESQTLGQTPQGTRRREEERAHQEQADRERRQRGRRSPSGEQDLPPGWHDAVRRVADTSSARGGVFTHGGPPPGFYQSSAQGLAPGVSMQVLQHAGRDGSRHQQSPPPHKSFVPMNRITAPGDSRPTPVSAPIRTPPVAKTPVVTKPHVPPPDPTLPKPVSAATGPQGKPEPRKAVKPAASLNVIPVITYFPKDQTAPNKVGQEVLTEFQSAQKALAVNYHTEVVKLFMDSVQKCHHIERDTLKKATSTEVEDKTRFLEARKNAAEGMEATVREECKELQEAERAMKSKFRQCLGMRFQDWDGTMDSLKEAIAKKEQPPEG